jgi:hypothetical protein
VLLYVAPRSPQRKKERLHIACKPAEKEGTTLRCLQASRATHYYTFPLVNTQRAMLQPFVLCPSQAGSLNDAPLPPIPRVFRDCTVLLTEENEKACRYSWPPVCACVCVCSPLCVCVPMCVPVCVHVCLALPCVPVCVCLCVLMYACVCLFSSVCIEHITYEHMRVLV